MEDQKRHVFSSKKKKKGMSYIFLGLKKYYNLQIKIEFEPNFRDLKLRDQISNFKK